MNRIALDVGEKRIGVAIAKDGVRIAVPIEALLVDGGEIESVKKIVAENGVEEIVIGMPRNQRGEMTLQSEKVKKFAENFNNYKVVFFDESATSRLAEERLGEAAARRRELDSEAAAIILQDYLESGNAN